VTISGAFGVVGAVAEVEETFGGEALGEQHVVLGQLEVVIGDAVCRELDDRAGVDQVADRDQHVVDVDRVVGRHE
jgi:hypothetical protein